MDKQTEIHGNAIKSVLSADQQKQFILFQANAGQPNSQGQMQGKGKGTGKVNGSGGGHGQGRGMGNNSKF